LRQDRGAVDATGYSADDRASILSGRQTCPGQNLNALLL
jgi:hypothetical protein